jgi:hypothetical protein
MELAGSNEVVLILQTSLQNFTIPNSTRQNITTYCSSFITVASSSMKPQLKRKWPKLRYYQHFSEVCYSAVGLVEEELPIPGSTTEGTTGGGCSALGE